MGSSLLKIRLSNIIFINGRFLQILFVVADASQHLQRRAKHRRQRRPQRAFSAYLSTKEELRQASLHFSHRYLSLQPSIVAHGLHGVDLVVPAKASRGDAHARRRTRAKSDSAASWRNQVRIARRSVEGRNLTVVLNSLLDARNRKARGKPSPGRPSPFTPVASRTRVSENEVSRVDAKERYILI